jgi:predicted HicB family RNase H-like nuclease
MNTMSHRRYSARIEFDERDNIFVGRILGVRTIISFHGETVAELRAAFESAVDDYLRECKEEGLEPEKPVSGKLLLRMPPAVHGRALVAAHAAGKSLNQWATEVLQRAVRGPATVALTAPARTGTRRRVPVTQPQRG